MPVVAVRDRPNQIARPLKVLVPLIKEELDAGDSAGLTHYRLAGDMLIEAKDQLAHGAWQRWLTKNFELSHKTALRYMRLARLAADKSDSQVQFEPGRGSLYDAIGEKRVKARAAWAPIHEVADKVNVERLAEERQTRDDEIKLHREIALQLIDLGFRAMATRLHPDKGGSRDAMSRLNRVRADLKSFAESRRFV